MRRFLIIIIFLSIMPLVSAREGSMKLLAVTERDDEIFGSPADLYLEIRPGSGNVFIDTFPFSRLDTQMSTRFAKEISCNFLDINCNRMDFFYRIKSESAIIGGPSAGASISVLTIALLKDIEYDKNIAITGTINSGGLIGPVGGIKAKIDAAKAANLSIVLIPKGERYVREEVYANVTNISNSNITVAYNETDLFEYAKDKNITLMEVSTIDDALYYFTGKRFKESKGKLTLDPFYLTTMRDVSTVLCDRTKEFEKEVLDKDSPGYYAAQNLSERGEESFSQGAYYSSASFCFGSNIRLKELILEQRNLSQDEIKSEIQSLMEEISKLDDDIAKYRLKNLPDLQTYIIVKERLIEAEDYLESAVEELDVGNMAATTHDLAYADERLFSAVSWSSFFNKGDTEFSLDKDALRESCLKKLSEAEERYLYMQVYFPLTLKDTRKEINRAYDDIKRGDYELCLFKASKAKAEANTVLTLISVGNEHMDDYLNQKLDLIREAILEQKEKGAFPILGYSYYEYSKSLKGSDTYSAMLYSEYALEMSNLDLYFEQPKRNIPFGLPEIEIGLIFTMGAIFGIAVGYFILRRDHYVHVKVKKK